MVILRMSILSGTTKDVGRIDKSSRTTAATSSKDEVCIHIQQQQGPTDRTSSRATSSPIGNLHAYDKYVMPKTKQKIKTTNTGKKQRPTETNNHGAEPHVIVKTNKKIAETKKAKQQGPTDRTSSRATSFIRANVTNREPTRI
jgi:hypothetical protein